MIKSELIARIAQQNPHLYATDVEAIVSAIFDRIVAALIEGDRVELRDFGSFCVRDREPRVSRNPRTGKRVTVPARTHVYFRPGKGMQARLNLERTDSEEAKQLLRAS